MKTAIQLLKFIAFGLLVAWLASCADKRKSKLAQQQHIIKFDLDLIADQNENIQRRLNQIETSATIAYTTYGLTKEQLAQKIKAAKEAEKVYTELLTYKTILNVKMVLLKIKYDSLGVELLKY